MTKEEYKALRLRMGWSHEKLAEQVGRHKSIISKRERGVKPITTEAELAIKYLANQNEAER